MRRQNTINCAPCTAAALAGSNLLRNAIAFTAVSLMLIDSISATPITPRTNLRSSSRGRIQDMKDITKRAGNRIYVQTAPNGIASEGRTLNHLDTVPPQHECPQTWDTSCTDDVNYRTTLGLSCSFHYVSLPSDLDGASCWSWLGAGARWTHKVYDVDDIVELIRRCPCTCGIECGTTLSEPPTSKSLLQNFKEYYDFVSTDEPTPAPVPIFSDPRSSKPTVVPTLNAVPTVQQYDGQPKTQPYELHINPEAQEEHSVEGTDLNHNHESEDGSNNNGYRKLLHGGTTTRRREQGFSSLLLSDDMLAFTPFRTLAPSPSPSSLAPTPLALSDDILDETLTPTPSPSIAPVAVQPDVVFTRASVDQEGAEPSLDQQKSIFGNSYIMNTPLWLVAAMAGAGILMAVFSIALLSSLRSRGREERIRSEDDNNVIGNISTLFKGSEMVRQQSNIGSVAHSETTAPIGNLSWHKRRQSHSGSNGMAAIDEEEEEEEDYGEDMAGKHENEITTTKSGNVNEQSLFATLRSLLASGRSVTSEGETTSSNAQPYM